MGFYDNYGPSWSDMDPEELSQIGNGRVVFSVREGDSASAKQWNVVWGNDGQPVDSVLKEGFALGYYRNHKGSFGMTAWFNGIDITDRVEAAARGYGGTPRIETSRPPRFSHSGTQQSDHDIMEPEGKNYKRRDINTDLEHGTDAQMREITTYCISLGDCNPDCRIYDICESTMVGNPVIPFGMRKEALARVNLEYSD